MVRQYSLNHLGGFSSTDTKLDFIGKPLSVITKHKKEVSNTAALEIRENFTYTDQDRLLTHTHRIGSGTTQLLANNNYDELGQLIKKDVGGLDISGAASLQKVDYSYNIRGWLKSINDVNELTPSTDPTDLFAFKISYNHVSNDLGGIIEPLYNGNISETFWKTDSDNIMRNYGYQYDALNRLTGSIYQKNGNETNSYNEFPTYDKNGNILTMKRTGYQDGSSTGEPFEIDNLIYTYRNYHSNQLMAVTDISLKLDGFKDGNPNGTDYRYDEFGNMIEDKNKKIDQIYYNHLNLPVKIEFSPAGHNQITYLYNAVGIKLGKIVSEESGSIEHKTHYLSGFQYLDEKLQFFPTAEGYVSVVNGDKFNYVYNYTDHLGNIRVSYSLDQADQQIKILEENHYYPFGLKHSNYNNNTVHFDKDENGGIFAVIRPVERSEYQYKFLGQERQDELGLNWDTFRYRNYDYAIGRFMGVDPITEQYLSISPYQFAHNNPVWKIELEGLEGVETSGTDVINREPVVLAVFYHGGPFGDGNIRSTTADTGGTGDRYNATAAYARSQGMDFKGAVISPSATQGPGVETGKTFLENNYQAGDQVIVYGYSYGGDNAVNLAEAVPNIPINTMIIVDSSDGPGRGATVDTSISNNVDTAYIFFQDSNSGTSNASSSSSSSSAGASTSGPVGSASGASSGGSSGSSGSSSSQSSNSPGSRGYRHTSEGTAKVKNINVSGPNVNHGNIQTKAGEIFKQQ